MSQADGYVRIVTQNDDSEAQRSTEQLGDTIQEALDTTPADNMTNAMGSLEDGISDTGDAALKTGDIIKANLVSEAVTQGIQKLGDVLKNSASRTIEIADGLDSSVNKIAAATNASAEEVNKLRSIVEQIYGGNFGEGFEDIADSISKIKQNLGELDDKELVKVTESAYALKDVFDYDIAESSRAVKAMMENFGVSASEAYDYIARGAQNGLDYSGELLDNISEYSVQFKKMGLSASDMFKIFANGSENSAWNLDKIGDAVKENAIRVIDLSESTTNAFTALGLDASQMASEFGAGGETAEKAFQKVMVGLQSIEDPVKRNQIGTALWGTMWEDLGETVILSSADLTDSFDQTADSMKKVQDVKYDDLGSMFEGLKRSVEMLVLPLGEELIPLLSDLIQDALPVIEDVLPDVIDLFGEFLEPVLCLAKEALPALTDLLTMLMDTTLKQLSEDLLPVLKDAFTTLKEPLEKLITEALPPLIDLFISLMLRITDLAATLLPPLIDVFLALLPPITDLIESLLPPLISLFESIAPILEDLAPIIGLVAEGIGKTLSEAIELVMPIVENIIEILGDLIGFISDVFTGDWESAWDHLVDYFKAVMNWIPITAETVINKFIDLINKMIKGVNKITGVIGIEAISEIDHVTLPRFHTGGVVDFKGKYEDTIIAKDGEMVLTEAQQKRLFDIANGFEYPTGSGGSGQVINQYTTENTEIINNNKFHVRDDSDIERIGEELAALQSRNDAGRGQ